MHERRALEPPNDTAVAGVLFIKGVMPIIQ
jgi:hypothetical protein